MIEVNNLTGFRVNEGFLKKIAQGVLASEEKNKTELSIALVGPGRIKELNKKYRRKNKATDVLSFNYGTLGEIVLCPKVIKRNARKYKSNFKQELARILIHGVLHLLGYDHEKSKTEAGKMEKKENYYFNLLNKKNG